jgi:protein-S-isoprenylcysteine O-methyltransferase Ste14
VSRLLGIVQSVLLAAFAGTVLLDRSPNLFDDPFLTVVGQLVALAGVVLIFVAINTMGKAVQVDAAPKEGAGLVTRGVYARLRHPIYTGIAVVIAGFVLRGITPSGAIVGAVALVYLWFKSRYEEKLLAARYPEYEAYRKTTLF